MKAHVIENGKVVNTIEVEALDLLPNLIEATGGDIGWDYIDGQFVDNRPKPEAPVVPAPTKEELLAQLQALTEKINSLE